MCLGACLYSSETYVIIEVLEERVFEELRDGVAIALVVIVQHVPDQLRLLTRRKALVPAGQGQGQRSQNRLLMRVESGVIN